MPDADHIVPFRSSLVQLRFIGEQLENRSLPIYELGAALISVQRIINKAYLFDRGELDRSTKLDNESRQKLALQIGSRRRASDGYGLIPFLTHPYVLPILQQVVATAITGIGAFVFYKIHQQRTPTVDNNQALIVAIYDDVRQLADRIGGRGKIQAIEIIPSSKVDARRIRLDSETKKYIKEIEREPVLGPITTIQGSIVRLYPRRFEVDVMFKGRRVRVRLSEANFQAVRYRAKVDTVVEFTGHPVYKLGAKTVAYREFNGEIIEITKAKLSEPFEE